MIDVHTCTRGLTEKRQKNSVQSSKMADIFANLLHTVKTEKSGQEIKFFDLARLGDEFHKLPFSIRILLESAVRNCDNFQVRIIHK